MTLAEYLDYDDPDVRCELEAGVLVIMPPESRRNSLIAFWLMTQFLAFVPARQLTNKAEIVVTGGRATCRQTDLMVLFSELAILLELERRETVTADMPPPLLVVEVVSPGKTNEDRDYRYKRSQYAARGIAEYWIVDPGRSQITILMLVEGLYEASVFQGDATLISPTFPDLQITVAQLFNADT